jgi:hypothetical protein
MSDANGRLQELAKTDVKLLPARELLVVIGDLFVELMPVNVEEATEEHLAQAGLMRLALAEVTDRVGRLCPTVSSTACSCGEAFATAEDLDDHFGEVFIPRDDTGLDGLQHAEVLASP